MYFDEVVGIGNFFEFEGFYDENFIIEKENQKVNELLDILKMSKEYLSSSSIGKMLTEIISL
jgi:hypothetical protein